MGRNTEGNNRVKCVQAELPTRRPTTPVEPEEGCLCWCMESTCCGRCCWDSFEMCVCKGYCGWFCMGFLTMCSDKDSCKPCAPCRDIIGIILYIPIVIVCCPCWTPLLCMGDDDGNYGCEFLGCTNDYDGDIPSLAAPVARLCNG